MKIEKKQKNPTNGKRKSDKIIIGLFFISILLFSLNLYSYFVYTTVNKNNGILAQQTDNGRSTVLNSSNPHFVSILNDELVESEIGIKFFNNTIFYFSLDNHSIYFASDDNWYDYDYNGQHNPLQPTSYNHSTMFIILRISNQSNTLFTLLNDTNLESIYRISLLFLFNDLRGVEIFFENSDNFEWNGPYFEFESDYIINSFSNNVELLFLISIFKIDFFNWVWHQNPTNSTNS